MKNIDLSSMSSLPYSQVSVPTNEVSAVKLARVLEQLFTKLDKLERILNNLEEEIVPKIEEIEDNRVMNPRTR
jgi:hypothetical protein